MRTGLDARTGTVLQGWDHCVQSIGKILTTRIGSRVMRRDFGSVLRDLQDRNPEPRIVMLCYVGIAQALRQWEPGFRLDSLKLVQGGPDGRYLFDLVGIFYPLGHLGDYSLSEIRQAAIGLGADGITVLGDAA
jgi:phage baseplate assembly protein W